MMLKQINHVFRIKAQGINFSSSGSQVGQAGRWEAVK